jgi:hypothetical protein
MANRHASSWEQWTDANRGRSQEEWIRDGFVDYGITVHLPPDPQDTLPLVRLLGRKNWNFLSAGPQGTNAPGAIPSYVHYNAYRWLRDSGFDPAKFASSNTTLVAESDVLGGLLRFCQWRAAYPGRDGLGVLAFGRNGTKDWESSMRPPIASGRVVAGVYAFIMISIIGGLILILRYGNRRAEKDVVEPGALLNGGPAPLLGSSGAAKGPPSVS